MDMFVYGLVFAGVTSIALGILHIPRVWGMVFTTWQSEIKGLSPLNRKLIDTVLVALCLVLVVLGMLTLALVEGGFKPDGFQVWFLALCSLFWIWRLIWQVVYFPIRKLNPGSRLLSLHRALIAIFVVDAVAYAMPVLVACS